VRIVLTLLAVALVAALSAALIAPLFVDWSAQRGFIEKQLSERLGAPVSIVGPIDVKFLPTPYLTAARVTVGWSAGSEPPLACEEMRLELRLGGLLNGQIRFGEVRLDHPILTLAHSPEASMPGLRARFAAFADRVALDRLIVQDGRLEFAAEGGAPLAFADIDIDASANSLRGPFRGSGSFSISRGEHVQIQFASAEIDGSGLPVKAEVDWGSDGRRATLDGELGWTSASSPSYAGAVTVSGFAPPLGADAPTPWRISGALVADRHHAALNELDLRLGPEERALELSGSAEADFAADVSLDAQLSGKELNIDSLLRRPGEDSAPPARLLEWMKTFGDAAIERKGLPLRLRLGFTTPSAYLGAQMLDQVSLSLASNPGEPLTGSFETGLPGQGHVRLSGTLELGAAAQFQGQMDAHVGDFGALKDWAAEGEPELASRLTALSDTFRYSEASAIGEVTASSAGFSARDLKLIVDRSTLTGSVTYVSPVGGDRGRLAVDLRSDALDIDAAPNLEASAGWFDDIDFDLDLEAAKLRIARVGDATVDSGSLVLEAKKTGATLALNRLSVADLGGATIEARGEATAAGRWATLRLDAAHLRDFAALVARVAPGRYSRMLVERADALSPAKATLEARRDGPALAGPFPLDFLKAEGEAGQTRFSVTLSNAPAPVGAIAADVSLDAADSSALLRQLGAKNAATPSGRAHLAASASGRWEAGFDARVEASLAGAALTWRGRYVPVPTAPDDRNLFGAATLMDDNLAPLLSTLGLAAPDAATTARADLSADFVLRGSEASLSRLTGTLAGAKIAGNLLWRPPPAPIEDAALGVDVALARSIAGEAPAATPAQISGAISLDRASLGALLALPLGAPASLKKAARWSEASFGPALLKPPRTDVRLRIGELDLWDGLPAQNLAARLQMDSGKFDLDEIALDVAGGRTSGRMTLRREGPTAAVEARIGLESIDVVRPAFRGRLGASLAIAGTGQSPSALVGGLVGDGLLTLAGVTIPRLDPAALARVMAKAEAPDAPIDETNVARSLTLELDRQPLAVPDGPAPAALNSGVVRVGPIVLSEPGGTVRTTGDFDLRSLNLQIRTVIEEAKAGKFWSGPPPSAAVSIRGPLDAPLRMIDVSTLVAGLATQAIARESDRIAGLEADMRERAHLNRVLKAYRFLDGRAAEIAAYEAEQARLKSEADRRRAEDAAVKAQEDQLKAKLTDPPPPIDPPEQPDLKPAAPKASVPKTRAAPADPTASGLY